jgi:hypothetical protein
MEASQAVSILLAKSRKLCGKMNLSRNDVLFIDAISYAVDAIGRDYNRTPAAQDAAQGLEVVDWRYACASAKEYIEAGDTENALSMLSSALSATTATPTTNSGEIGRKLVGGGDSTAAEDDAHSLIDRTRLWDSQYVNIVNDPYVLGADDPVDAVAKAVKMTEQKMAENFDRYLRRLSRREGS